MKKWMQSVTKPGGVTISEALRKRLPIFVHSFLPGQEEINLTYLKKQGLVFELEHKESLEKQLFTILKDSKKMNHWEKSINLYQKEIELEESEKIVAVMTKILHQKTESIASRAVETSSILQVARA